MTKGTKQIGYGQQILALLASSRFLQALLSLAQPLFAAFLAYGGVPETKFLTLLVIGSTAGMFSIFALNDLLDYDLDRKRLAKTKKEAWDVDSALVLHPLSKGFITKTQQIAWIAGNIALACSILFYLSPAALGLYMLAIILEIIYCRLATISELKVIIAGLLVSVGAMIGWFAAGGGLSPTLPVVAVVFFVWEIGGRNIPNDFSDMQQDKRLGIKTVPLVHGAVTASMLIFIFAFMTVAANALLAITSLIYAASTSLIGIALLIFPALSLRKKPVPAEALKYFNKASFYPLFLFGTLVAAYVMAVY